MSKETGQPISPAAVDGQDLGARDLMAIVTEFLRELHPQQARSIDVAPSSRIERDLGIDSLGRTELALRIERAFHMKLPAREMAEAETVSDLAGAGPGPTGGRTKRSQRTPDRRPSDRPRCDRGTYTGRGVGAARSAASGAAAPYRAGGRDHHPLSGEPAIVAKRELARQFLTGPLLRRLGIPFVERYDVSGSLQDARALTDLARKGRVLVVFPEGAFTRRAGLSGFYLGAFKVAAEAGLKIVPGAIRGTRSMFRGEQWFPRRVPLSIEIAEAVAPTGTDFAAILQLRDAVREAILGGCGEPDLGGLAKPEPPPA